MPLETEHLDSMSECSQKLHRLALWLAEIADCCSRLGLKVSKELYQIAEVQTEIAQTIHKLSGKIIKSDLDEANMRSTAILKAALAGIELVETDKKSAKH